MIIKSPWILFFTALAMMASTAGVLSYLKTHQKLGQPGVKVGAWPLSDQKGNRVAHDIGGQSYREYWTLVMQDKIPYFRIAAAVGSDGSLVWYHPELLTLGQPLLSPVDAKMGTEELYDRYLKNSPVVPALWPTNIGDIKKSEKGL